VRFGAVDADVCKTYVEMDLGIAILATVAVDPEYDRNLRARDASHLFESSPTFVRLRRNTYLRGYVSHFIGMLASELTPDIVRSELKRRIQPPKLPGRGSGRKRGP
jgi:LysR family cys regulon transcriptional activator